MYVAAVQFDEDADGNKGRILLALNPPHVATWESETAALAYFTQGFFSAVQRAPEKAALIRECTVQSDPRIVRIDNPDEDLLKAVEVKNGVPCLWGMGDKTSPLFGYRLTDPDGFIEGGTSLRAHLQTLLGS